MDDQQNPKPKIIIDEDWKSQVESEKEEAAANRTDASPTAAEAGAAGPLPQASLTSLVSMLATQSMVSLGQAVMPDGQRIKPDLEQARYLIDTISVLEEKTKGNCTPEESQLLSNLVHELRMAFVAAQNSQGASTEGDPKGPSPIIGA